MYGFLINFSVCMTPKPCQRFKSPYLQKSAKLVHSSKLSQNQARDAVTLPRFFLGQVVASHHRQGYATLDTHDAPFFAIGVVFFPRSHHSTHPSILHQIKHPLSKIVVNERAEPIEFIFCAFVECFVKFCYLWKKLGFSEQNTHFIVCYNHYPSTLHITVLTSDNREMVDALYAIFEK